MRKAPEGALEDRGGSYYYEIRKVGEGERVEEKRGRSLGVSFLYVPVEQGEQDGEPEEQAEKSSELKTFDIPGVEIFRAGTWTDSAGRRLKYTPSDIEAMAAAGERMKGRLEPPVKLGHDREQKLLAGDGLPAAGWLRNIRASGGRLYADLEGVPKRVFDLIRAGGYRKRSLEVIHDYVDEATGERFRHVAAGLALLGANLPSLNSLADISALYEATGGSAVYLYESGAGGEILESAEKADAGDEDCGEVERLRERVKELESELREIKDGAAHEPEQDAEEPEEETVEKADAEEEPAAVESELRAAAEELRKALSDLEEYRARDERRRREEREKFVDRQARKSPPAFRRVVADVLALLEGDMPEVSSYSLADGTRTMDVAAAFREYLRSMSDHPAMSEYGRERCGEAVARRETETDARILDYCAEHGLDPDRAGDYSLAAVRVLKYTTPPEMESA